jgi:hypothetical protein
MASGSSRRLSELVQDWSQLAFEEVDEPVLVRPDLDQDEVVKAGLDRVLDGREVPLW